MEESKNNHSFGQGLKFAAIIEEAIASAVKKTNADLEKIQKIIDKPGVIFDFFENLFADGVEVVPLILRLISGGEKIMIETLNGKAYISDAKNIFRSNIGRDFKDWGLNQPGPATFETLLDINEMVGDGTFAQIFTSITKKLDRLVMTQAQIIRFCEKHRNWLRPEGYSTFFLTKVGREYFVVRVSVHSDGLLVRVYRLEDDDVWSGGYRHRVVSPHISLVE